MKRATSANRSRAHLSRSRARSRGFTLPELMMATAAGLVVSAAAFMLARNASIVFQEETRITAAQLSATLGMQRLRTDLARAGFLGTANVKKDPFACNTLVACPDSGSWPPLLAGLRALTVEQMPAINGIVTERITVTGSFETAEEFPVRAITGSGTKMIRLQELSAPLMRTCGCKPVAECLATLQRIFKQDRIVRVTTTAGKKLFSLVDSVSIVGPDVDIKLQPSPKLPSKDEHPFGYAGLCNDCTVSVISAYRYEIQTLQGHPQYGPLVAPIAAAATGDDTRTELTRVELDRNGLPIPATLELVAEYAVDLRFGITVINPTSAAVNDLPIESPPNPLVYSTATDDPQRIRAVHVRFATRARAPDRETDMTGGPDGRAHRFPLTIGTKTRYARMRTLYSEVALQNLVDALW